MNLIERREKEKLEDRYAKPIPLKRSLTLDGLLKNNEK